MLKEKLQKAVEIINRNDRGGFTIPTNKLYPHQWNWDSAFSALGIATYNKMRAWQELILLINSLEGNFTISTGISPTNLS